MIFHRSWYMINLPLIIAGNICPKEGVRVMITVDYRGGREAEKGQKNVLPNL